MKYYLLILILFILAFLPNCTSDSIRGNVVYKKMDKLDFSLITGGDGLSGSCMHTELALELTLRYVEVGAP